MNPDNSAGEFSILIGQAVNLQGIMEGIMYSE